MAFIAEDLALAVDTIGGGNIRIHFYDTDDAEEVVTATDYFTKAARRGLRQGDLIVVRSGGTAFLANVDTIGASGSATIGVDRNFILEYETVTALGAASVPPIVHAVRLQGFANAGDGGEALWKGVGSEPATSDKKQSADGAWFKIATGTPSVAALGVLEGNSEAANATALALVENTDRTAYGLGENILLPANTFPRKIIQGNGSITKGGQRFDLNVPGQSARAYLNELAGRIGNTDTLTAAIQSGDPVPIVFVTDSIFYGSQVDFHDSPAGLVEAELKRRYPTVVWQVTVLAVPGIGWGNLLPFYVGAADLASVVAGESFWFPKGQDMLPPTRSLWPDGTTEGATVLEHAAAKNPAAIIFALNMNFSGTVSDNIAVAKIAMETLDGLVEAAPSRFIVNSIIPSRASDSTASDWRDVQELADALRWLATEVDATLVDVNAVNRSNRDGVDVLLPRRRVIRDLTDADYATWTTRGGTRPSVVAGVMTATAAGSVYRPIAATDCNISFDLTLPGNNDIFDFVYRQNPANPLQRYLWRLKRIGGSPVWENYYYEADGTGGAIDAGGSLSSATTFKCELNVRGSRHEAWVNNQKIGYGSDFGDAELYHYGFQREGYHGFEFTQGGPTVRNFFARLGYPSDVGHSLIAEEQELRRDNNFLTDQFSQGGVWPNHPSIVAIRMNYLQAFSTTFFRAIDRAVSAIPVLPPTSYIYEGVASGQVIAAGDDFTVSITPTGGAASYSPAAVKASQGANVFVANQHSRIFTATGFNVRLIKNSVDVMLTETVSFPHEGKWRVSVSAFASSHPTDGSFANFTADAIEAK